MQPDERLEPTGRPDEAPAWVVSALAVALVMLVPGLALGHGAAHAGPGPDLTPPAAVADPFTADPCPTRPATRRAGDEVTFPETLLRSIRLCPTRRSQPWGEPLDALLNDSNSLVRSLRTAVADPSTCPGSIPAQDRTAIQVSNATGGVTTLVGTPCTPVGFYGRVLSFATLETAVRRSIDAQRRVLRAAPYAPAVSCRRPATRVSLDPSVERIVSAASCRQHMPYVLTRRQLATVQQAWASAGSIPSPEAGTVCLAQPRPHPPPQLILATDFGDLVRPVWDACRGSWTVSWGTRLVLLPTVETPAISEW